MTSADHQRTVIIRRGPKGYGFNLAEQYPCYLSAVHEGGVAERKGLLIGDRLLAINGIDVTLKPHKEIVDLIACAEDELQLTVTSKPTLIPNSLRPATMAAQSSSDSDSDNEVWRRQRIHLARRMKHRTASSSCRHRAVIPSICESIAEKELFMNGSVKSKKSYAKQRTPSTGGRSRSVGGRRHKDSGSSGLPRYGSAYYNNTSSLKSYKKNSSKFKCTKQTMNRSRSEPDFMRDAEGLHQASMIVHPGMNSSGDGSSPSSSDSEEETFSSGIILKVVLVYIGAVPVPHLQISRKHVIRSALQSLRAQNVRAHTVLLEIFSHQIIVTNSKGIVVNRFKADCIAFVTACAENKQFFGLTTVHHGTTGKEINFNAAAVCHIFAVDPELHLHSFHYNYAKKFGIRCSRDAQTNFCAEFPHISSSILDVLSYVIRMSQMNKPISTPLSAVKQQQRQPGYHSSNSDSGIGNGKDDDDSPRDVPRYSTGYPGTNRANVRTLNRHEFLRSSDDISQSSTDQSSYLQVGSTTSGTASANCSVVSTRTSGNLKVRFDEAANSIIESDASTTTTDVRPLRPTTPLEKPAAVNNEGMSTIASSSFTQITSPTALSSSVCRENTSTSTTMVENVGTSNVQVLKDGYVVVQPKISNGSKIVNQQKLVDVNQKTDPYQAQPLIQQLATTKQKKSQSEVDLLADTQLISLQSQRSNVVVIGSGAAVSSYPKRSSNSNNHQTRRYLYCSSSVNDVSQLNPNNINNCCEYLDDDDDDEDNRSLFAVPAAPVKKSLSDEVPSSSLSICSNNNTSSEHNNDHFSTNGSQSKQNNNHHGSLLKRLARVDMRLSVRMKQAKKERLELWANDFDKLLRDAAGLYSFSEFLRKQYCQENINFWIACENYKVTDDSERVKAATELYEHHFAPGCGEPVNVDSAARQTIQDLVSAQKFSSGMFNVAQYQIFHLMKYDCYPRFLKSDDYHQCWDTVDKGHPLTEMKELFLNNISSISASNVSLNKPHSKDDDKNKRKSILPWKTKFGGGRKKKHESLEQGLDDDQLTVLSNLGNKRKHAWRSSKHLSTPAEAYRTVHPSSGSAHTSPTRYECSARPPDVVPQPDPPSSPSPGPSASYLDPEPSTSSCCTAILPTGERVTLGLPPIEKMTVGEWLHDVAVRFGLNPDPAATSIVDVDNTEPLNLAISARKILENKTIRVEGGVLVTIDIPCVDIKNGDRKKVKVKAPAASTSAQALIPVLNRYGLTLDNMVITIDGTNEVLPNHAPIISVNDKELVLRTQEEFQAWLHRDHDESSNNKSGANRKTTSSFNDDRRNFKLKDFTAGSNKNSVTTDLSSTHDLSISKHNLTNGHKGGGMLKFVKKPETNKIMDRKSSASVKGPKAPVAAAVVARSRKSTASMSREEMMQRVRDEKKLAELLNRAQASSFDDQRGSMVKNCELPEFLKVKNPQQTSMDDSLLYNNNNEKAARPCRPTEMVHRKLCASPMNTIGTSDEQSEDDFNLTPTCQNFDEDTFLIPSHEEAEQLFGGGVVSTAEEELSEFQHDSWTERKSLSEFGLTPAAAKSNNISVVSVGAGSDDSTPLKATKNQINTSKSPLTVSSRPGSVIVEKSLASSPFRRPPPPYPGHNRGSLRKSAAIDDQSSLPDEMNNFVGKRKGVYVDEDEWQVDYV